MRLGVRQLRRFFKTISEIYTYFAPLDLSHNITIYKGIHRLQPGKYYNKNIHYSIFG